jgi:hypothetical protein
MDSSSVLIYCSTADIAAVVFLAFPIRFHSFRFYWFDSFNWFHSLYDK